MRKQKGTGAIMKNYNDAYECKPRPGQEIRFYDSLANSWREGWWEEIRSDSGLIDFYGKNMFLYPIADSDICIIYLQSDVKFWGERLPKPHEQISQPITPELLVTDGWLNGWKKDGSVMLYKNIKRACEVLGLDDDLGDCRYWLSVEVWRDGSFVKCQLIMDYEDDEQSVMPMPIKTMIELKALYAVLSGQVLPPRVELVYVDSGNLPEPRDLVIAHYLFRGDKYVTRARLSRKPNGTRVWLGTSGPIDGIIYAWQPMPNPAPMSASQVGDSENALQVT